MHEHDHVEVLRRRPKPIASPRDLGPDHVGPDLAAPEAEPLDAVLQLGGSGVWARATKRSGCAWTIEARCSFTVRLILWASSGSSQYMKWNGEGEMACTSMPILSMSRSRVSTDVKLSRTFSICLRFVSRESAFENLPAGSRSGVMRCLTISSAAGTWTWQ
jgi:hypothetical protein